MAYLKIDQIGGYVPLMGNLAVRNMHMHTHMHAHTFYHHALHFKEFLF